MYRLKRRVTEIERIDDEWQYQEKKKKTEKEWKEKEKKVREKVEKEMREKILKERWRKRELEVGVNLCHGHPHLCRVHQVCGHKSGGSIRHLVHSM